VESLSLSLMSLMSLKLYVVVEQVIESMHTHIKLGAHALLNVNHSYHVDLRAYALHVDLRAYALHVDFKN